MNAPTIPLMIPSGPDLATAKTFILKSSHIFEHLKTHDVYKPKNDEEDEDEGGGYGDDDGDGDGEGGGNEGKQEGGQEEDATVVTLRRSKRLRRGRDLGP